MPSGAAAEGSVDARGAGNFPSTGTSAPAAVPPAARDDEDFRGSVLYICIPAYNEAPTVGVLLWRIRKMFQEFSREYEVLVYDDGSTDATAETLAPYRDVMPLTVLGGTERKGYAAALDALCRAVSKRTRYPRRDAAIFLQGDFTDQPEHIPELVKRFEGGADVVVAERPAAAAETAAAAAPVPVRRLGRVAPWVLRPFVRLPGVRDPFGSYRLYRISVLRDVVRAAGARGVVVADPAAPSWAANVELLLNAAAFARRVETVELAPRYDVRPRETRIRPFADAMGLFRFARGARARRLTPNGATPAGGPRDVTATATDGAPATTAATVSEPADVVGPKQPPGDADASAAASERRRSRRGRAERRAERPSTAGTAAGAEALDEQTPPQGEPGSASTSRRSRRGAPRATAPVEPTAREDGDVDGMADDDAPARAGNDGGIEVSPSTPVDAAADEAASEARRQRQRARRKRSRQRRAAAARDGSAGESSSTESSSEGAAASPSPASGADLADGAAASPARDRQRSEQQESAPPPAAERATRGDAGRDAEPAQSSPAASPVVP